MRCLPLILLLAFGAIAVPPAAAQVIPDPRAGRQLYISNKVGKIIERLQPNGDRYDVYDVKRQSLPIGYAKLLGRRMAIYDLNDNVVATMRAELLPPDSGLSIITIVRDRDGHPIGFLERY
jgi:hypothetical protein